MLTTAQASLNPLLASGKREPNTTAGEVLAEAMELPRALRIAKRHEQERAPSSTRRAQNVQGGKATSRLSVLLGRPCRCERLINHLTNVPRHTSTCPTCPSTQSRTQPQSPFQSIAQRLFRARACAANDFPV